MGFRELSDGELDRLDDEELLAYIVGARSADRAEAARRALMFLIHGYWGTLVTRARLKIPSGDVEDVAGEALATAIKSSFDGQSRGEFRVWLDTIIRRRIADYHRRREGQPEQVPLLSEHETDDEVWGAQLAIPFEGTAIDVERAQEQAYTELEKDEHRQVIDEFIYNDRPAREVAEEIPGMTEANVHQIASRFRKRIREILEAGDTSP